MFREKHLLISGSIDEKKSHIDELKNSTNAIDSQNKQSIWLEKSIESPQGCAQQCGYIWNNLIVLS
jgi:hypothetical protein